MGINAATLRLLAAKGLSMEDIIEVAESLEKKADPTNAQRQARYRAKRKNNTVTVTGVSPPIEDHTPLVSSNDETAQPRKSKSGKPDEVSDPVWRDFTAHRKAQKAPVSETVISGIRREADRAGWTLDAALAETVARGWRGFKADWVAGKPQTGPPGDNISFLDTVIQRQNRLSEANQ